MSSTHTGPPQHPELQYWATLIERLGWAGFLLDSGLCLSWVSPELRRFLGSPDEDELGHGLQVAAALRAPGWRRIAPTGTRDRLLRELAPMFEHDRSDAGDPSELPPGEARSVAPRPVPAIATSIDYLEPQEDGDLPVYSVDLLVTDLRDSAGERTGVLALGYMSVRPGLVSLLARGDQTMYERMAKLVEPASRQGAILFCDLESSTELSRTLPSAEYFQLIRSLWTEIDGVVAANSGIVGKHAGDGASAFFLVDDLGSSSAAATAAIQTARSIHERSERVFDGALESPCLMRVGLHWGDSLYIGQLVPGGRLDVTALGDAVNECARVQECAGPHQTLASKDLIERLTAEDGRSVEVDLDKVRYKLAADLPTASEKSLRTVGAMPVTLL